MSMKKWYNIEMILKEYTIDECLLFYGVIYVIMFPNRKYYVGQTVDIKTRFSRYRKYKVKAQIKVYNALIKYGQENCKFVIIDLAENREELNSKEKYYIELYDSIKSGYNLTTGGKDCFLFSKSTKKKMSNKKKTTYLGKNNPFYGKTHTIETRLKISQMNKEYNKKFGNSFKGKKHSDKTKKIISLKQTGRIHTKVHVQKCHKYGKESWFSKKYIFINPSKEKFIVEGKFKEFIKNNNLALTVCKKFIDKGVIPSPKNEFHNRMSYQRRNTTGWEIIKL